MIDRCRAQNRSGGAETVGGQRLIRSLLYGRKRRPRP